ncbi:MAG: heme ABC exporter ATP-binding protein CcmA [Rhizobiales bacterium]|nr:heme ABC exporter ATP-binding protein CcmA [Hyphomicrobiales bacterium]
MPEPFPEILTEIVTEIPAPNSGPPIRLAVEDLGCRRGERLLFSGLTFRAESGSLTEIKGANGIGKSSLMRILGGLLSPASGYISVTVSGAVATSLRAEAHYLAHDNALKSAFTVRENLAFWHGFSDQPGLTPQAALYELGILSLVDLPAGVLSAGQKRRVAFARLLVSRKPVWLLDEPTAALDSRADKRVGELISRHVTQGGIVIAATHLPLALDLDQSVRAVIDLADYPPEEDIRNGPLS